jgi:hypothetical protein
MSARFAGFGVRDRLTQRRVAEAINGVEENLPCCPHWLEADGRVLLRSHAKQAKELERLRRVVARLKEARA